MASKMSFRQILGSSLLLFSPLILAQSFSDMAELDISDLMYLEVTSVSKKSQKISEAAASIYVLTQDDLQRSGTNSVPEALRMVPGLSVAQLDANKWAISARGFNHLYANKLLVLIDGVSVYSPLFSGVHWEAQDLPIENIERIEVIRGPGATLWGANAVNGVINITTKRAKNTQGVHISQRLGTNDKTITSGRYGGEIGRRGHFRVFTKIRQTRANVNADGSDAADDWEQARTGFRADWQQGDNDSFTLQINHYQGESGETLSFPVNPLPWGGGDSTQTVNDVMRTSGSNILARWTHTFDNSEITAQTYAATQRRTESIFHEQYKTVDVEIQHRFTLFKYQEIIWGGGYRMMKGHTTGSKIYSFEHETHSMGLSNLFIQNEFTVIPNQLKTITGIKIEKNDFTNNEIQPNARIIWTPTPHQSYWTAISQAVRTPSMNDSYALISSGVQPADPVSGFPEMLISLKGNPNFKSEKLIAYEVGLRLHPIDALTFDASVYYHDYSYLQGVSYNGNSDANNDTFIDTVNLSFNNKQKGSAKGLEVSAHWQPYIRWRLLAGYSFLDLNLTEAGSTTVETQEQESPKHQFQLRSYFDINHDMQFNTILYHVSNIKIRDAVIKKNQNIPSYNRLDVNIAWQANKTIKLTSGINNMLQKQHAEFGSVPFVNATEVERSIYVQLNIDLK